MSNSKDSATWSVICAAVWQRFQGGQDTMDIARTMKLSEPTVCRALADARAWRHLKRQSAHTQS